MIRRKIGNSGPEVNAIGLGCMGMSVFYGAPMEEKAAIELVHQAIDLGVDHFDTAELYGGNEKLLGQALEGKRDKVFLATKIGPRTDPATGARTYDGSAANARRAIEQSLRHLRTDHVDLYYIHRVDRAVPIEETVGEMARMVEEGKVKAIGVSEARADTLRRAAKVHPISAVQMEYSLFQRHVEAEVLPACAELGATLVAYAPLGRGLLTGALKKDWAHAETDFRAQRAPRFQGENFDANLALVGEIEALAATKGVPASQIALAWVLSRGANIVAIPGTTKLANLKSNLAAADVTLSADDKARLETLAARVKGDRYDETGMKIVDA